MLTGAFDGPRLVGAATGARIQDRSDEFAAAFGGRSIDLSAAIYRAESVRRRDGGGQEIGQRVFDLGQDHVRAPGCAPSTVWVARRPPKHPSKPAGPAAFDPFRRKRGDGSLACGCTFAMERPGPAV
ncbi:hypothetical protein [Salipiger aestuarii]|uniref:hypothetical protein n=1 Tax=Salipiger aestuarii TaxID=568098 RepID=UPI000DB9F6B5|nr:hypothetical protein [Salipiger aestuarii]